MDPNKCIAEGGEWIKGISDLSSHCAFKSSNMLPPIAPTITDIEAQKLKDPPKSQAKPQNLDDLVTMPAGRARLLGIPDASMMGRAFSGAKVLWPLCPGDVLWAAQSDDPWAAREFGVYLGRGLIVSLGPAKPAKGPVKPHWAALPTGDRRSSITTPNGFCNGGESYCGVYNTQSHKRSRLESIKLAAATVGAVLTRLNRPDAQHIATYIGSGYWLNKELTLLDNYAMPEFFSGRHGGEEDTRQAPSVEVQGNKVHVRGPSFEESYDLVSLTDELYRQKKDVQPFHDPMTKLFFKEGDVATILAEGVALAKERDGNSIIEDEV